MHRNAMTRRAAVSGLAVLALSGCSFSFGTEKSDPPEEKTSPEGEGQTEGQDPTTQEESPESEDPTTEEEADTGAGAGAPGTVVEIGESFTDPGLGDQITVVSVMRDNPSEVSSYIPEEGGEILYLTVEITPSDDWYGLVSDSPFYLNENGEAIKTDKAFNDEIRGAGLTPISLADRSGGATGPVSMAFAVDVRQDTYQAAYVRAAGTVESTGEEIPEFIHEFTIPAV